MFKKKTVVFAVTLMLVIASTFVAVPALGAAAAAPGNAAQITRENKPKVLIRLLLIRDEAKVDAFIARAVEAGKLNADQAVKVKTFWTAHHNQFARNFVLRRLLMSKDEAKVRAFLDNAVEAGKIQPEQAARIIEMWEILHAPGSGL